MRNAVGAVALALLAVGCGETNPASSHPDASGLAADAGTLADVGGAAGAAGQGDASAGAPGGSGGGAAGSRADPPTLARWAIRNCTDATSALTVVFTRQATGEVLDVPTSVPPGTCRKSCFGPSAIASTCLRESDSVGFPGYCATHMTGDAYGCTCTSMGEPGIANATTLCRPGETVCWTASDGETGCGTCVATATPIGLKCP